jgi:structural maintenance of chromosome 4
METNSLRLAGVEANLEEARAEHKKHEDIHDRMNKELEDTSKAYVARINDVKQAE